MKETLILGIAERILKEIRYNNRNFNYSLK